MLDPTSPATPSAAAGAGHEGRLAHDVPPRPGSPASTPRDDAATRGDIALLGLLGYASLSSFDHLAQGSSNAEDLADTLLLARLAAQRLEHMQQVEVALAVHGADLVRAMAPFRRPVDEFHRATVPTSWSEALVKVHLVQGMARDFTDLVAPHVTTPGGSLLAAAVAPTELDDQVELRVREVVAADPHDTGRLSLFARRVLGEALGQAQRVAARESDLASLVTGAEPGSTDDIARISQVMADISTRHARRVDALGLFG